MLVRPGFLVQAVVVAPTITGITATLVSGTTIEVVWIGNDMPFGVTYELVWSITSGGSGGGTVSPATSPQNVVADSFSGGNGSFTVNAYDGITLVATDNYTGPIIV